MEEDRGSTWPNWLWILIVAALALLLILWLFGTWEVESNVQPGASPDGLTYPPNPGIAVEAPKGGVDVTLPGEAPAQQEAPIQQGAPAQQEAPAQP